MVKKKAKLSKREQADRDYRINSALVMGGLLLAGAYILIKGCEINVVSKSPLEEKVQQMEAVKPAERDYSISEVLYKN